MSGEQSKEGAERDHVLMVLNSGNTMALFWFKGCSGYTHNLDDAHLFTEAEAYSQRRCRPEVDVPIPLKVAQERARYCVAHDPLLAWRRAEDRKEGDA